MRFMLGTHVTTWLSRTTESVPYFVSHRQLVGRKSEYARAVVPWALDSGGFSELSMFGEWRTSAKDYIASVRRYVREIGMMEWAAIQDWMCEPWLLKKTGLSINEHQTRTVRSYLHLREQAPDINWTPVLQGWAQADYLRHAEMYADCGVDLAALPLVGLGSVCRRQATNAVGPIIASLYSQGIRLHGFGFKVQGLKKHGHMLASADSMAWSFTARHQPPLPGCVGHINCANCWVYALRWRERVVRDYESAQATRRFLAYQAHLR